MTTGEQINDRKNARSDDTIDTADRPNAGIDVSPNTYCVRKGFDGSIFTAMRVSHTRSLWDMVGVDLIPR
jgi:hypothetical protein